MKGGKVVGTEAGEVEQMLGWQEEKIINRWSRDTVCRYSPVLSNGFDMGKPEKNNQG